MLLFAVESYETMAAALGKAANLSLARFRVARFENGELHVDVQTPVRGETCFILGSIAPPDRQMLFALLLAHTLKKEGARRVTAIFPYLAYTRQDKDKPGESLAAAWAGAIAQASGIDRVITIDMHSEHGRKLFPMPVVSLSPAGIFAEAIGRFGMKEATIIAPDEGAIPRCEAVKKSLGAPLGKTPYFVKQRTAAGITHSRLAGEVGCQAVIIDDILDTGATLVSACERLRAIGAKEINIMVTHGLFTGGRWKRLWNIGVERIFCTDSVPIIPLSNENTIERLSIIPVLGKELCPLVKAARE